MRYIEDNPSDKYYVVYVITDSVYNVNKYYKEIVKAILNCESIKKRNKVINSKNNVEESLEKAYLFLQLNLSLLIMR
ncbi:hypothetical protein [Clostridium tagluense]|uniref:hypothetical protein n=1 Tax=Clostridium tagluense TaxID=360422 RepID=UPI001CF4290F|nr:hypothetical protein [Clostridium tagluense]MCB2297567.1 hypothetical protein [Clostridium tagluense]